MGTSGTCSSALRKVRSPGELRRASRDSSAVVAVAEVLIWICDRNFRVSRPCRQGTCGSSGVSTGESGRVSFGDMHIFSPLELEKQCQASCRVDISIVSFLSRCHRAVTPTIVFSVGPRDDHRVSYRGVRCIWIALGHQGILEWWHDPWSSS